MRVDVDARNGLERRILAELMDTTVVDNLEDGVEVLSGVVS